MVFPPRAPRAPRLIPPELARWPIVAADCLQPAQIYRMSVASLTRRVSFAAAHRYRRPEWDDAKNEAVFGACARPNYHGHSYVCEVTVTGPIDETTGFIVDLGELDRALDTEVRQRFDHRNINLEVPEFADGSLVPTGENLSRFIFERVQAALLDKVRVTSVTVAEDASLSASYRGE
jgi:6-pyruvoyltetrahydropterin/6-carboxytetrahydropterin synthase